MAPMILRGLLFTMQPATHRIRHTEASRITDQNQQLLQKYLSSV